MSAINQSQFHKELRDTYDKYSQDRDASSIQEWKVVERGNFLTLLKHEKKQTLLEIGSGPGRDALFFQENGFKTTCIDLSPAMIAACLQKGLSAQVMDMTDLTFPDGSFDAVYTLNALLHLTKAEFPIVLHQIDRVLKPGGLIYLGMYGGYEFAGILERDHYIPKRFFSYFTDDGILLEVMKVFDLLSFGTVYFEPEDPFHFQSMILRKK